jgi:NhaA family Na+:H+ antiporter
MCVALLALILANSPWSQAYFDFWQHKISLQVGGFYLLNHGGHPFSILDCINDALMAVFFFTTGLEIKRESLVGELSSVRQAMLPIIGACGGMIVPVVIFFLVARGTPAQAGIAIPMATDIAFSLGVLSLFSKRVPLSLKIFLTTFAVADDIGGIGVIAVFYTSHLSWFHLLLSLGVLGILCWGNFRGIYNRWFYLFFGVILWYLFLQGGIHATIAGVIVAFTIPAVPRYNAASKRVISPLQSLSDNLSGFVAYGIMPLFAFANAGVSIVRPDGGVEFGVASLGIILGLVFGKFIGIYSFAALTIKWKLAKMPVGMTYRNLTGVCLLGGVGFTVALFLAQLSFSDAPDLLAQSKIGVVCGTVIAAGLGYIVLKLTLPKQPVICKS